MPNIAATPLKGEDVLADDYPVHIDYLYLTPKGVKRSPLRGSVAQLKKALDVTEVRKCDLGARGFFG